MRYLGLPVQFHFFHIFDSLCTFSWVLIISDKLQWPRKGSWGTSWILPSKSGSKYFLKNILTENIWKIFAPWRGPQVKFLFSTFFQVTVYLVDTQNFRATWRPLHVFCEYLCKYWSYLIQQNICHNLLGVVYHVKKLSTIFDENWSHNINLKKKCSISRKVIWKPIVQWVVVSN